MYYKNILWCPIDIPKPPLLLGRVQATSEWAEWKFKKITEKRPSPYDVTELTQEMHDNFPDLVKWLSYFPYKTIRNIKINYQIDEVSTHIDFTRPQENPELYHNNSLNEPCGYRVLISGKRKNALYIEHNGKKIYPEMPDDTDVYVLGHTNVPHGVDSEPDRNTMFLHFEIDHERHVHLLEKSFKKYEKYAILAS